MADFDYLNLMLLVDLLCGEQKANEDAVHNREVEMIVSVGEKIMDHCLAEISRRPEIAEQEGGVNTLVRSFVLSIEAWSYFTRDNKGSWWQHTGENEPSIISYSPIDQDSIPDLVINTEALRVELKSVSLFTSKEKIPSDFFSKDINHLHGDSDFDKFDYEGTTRANRRAEMCLLVGDLDIISRSRGLRDLIGDDFLSVKAREYLRNWGVNGVRYEIRDHPYKSKTRRNKKRVCAILAFPGKKSGERT